MNGSKEETLYVWKVHHDYKSWKLTCAAEVSQLINFNCFIRLDVFLKEKEYNNFISDHSLFVIDWS